MDLGHGDKWRLDPCQACPAQRLPPGEFDISDRPGPASRYDPTAGYRVNTATGHPECVHPARLGLGPGLGDSCQACVPEPPADAAGLEDWFRATLRAAPARSRAAALAEAESTARERFPTGDVLGAMRRALSVELTHGILVRDDRT